jgi:hypothetical protein
MGKMISTSTMVGDAYHATDFLVDRRRSYVGGSFSIAEAPIEPEIEFWVVNRLCESNSPTRQTLGKFLDSSRVLLRN